MSSPAATRAALLATSVALLSALLSSPAAACDVAPLSWGKVYCEAHRRIAQAETAPVQRLDAILAWKSDCRDRWKGVTVAAAYCHQRLGPSPAALAAERAQPRPTSVTERRRPPTVTAIDFCSKTLRHPNPSLALAYCRQRYQASGPKP